LCIGILTSNAATENPKWQSQFALVYDKLKQHDLGAFIDDYEKSSEFKLSKSDRNYLRSTLSRVLKKENSNYPDLKFSTNKVEITYAGKTSVLTFQKANDNSGALSWRINGVEVPKNVQGSLQETSGFVEKILQSVMVQQKTSWLNFVLPSAEADTGTIVAILLCAAVVGAIIYYANKTTKATTNAINYVGKKTGDSIENVGKKAGDAVERNSKDLSNLTNHINSKIDQVEVPKIDKIVK
jgi:hypothetical protein